MDISFTCGMKWRLEHLLCDDVIWIFIINILSVFFVWGEGQHLAVLKAFFCLVLKAYSWQGSGDHTECQRLNLVVHMQGKQPTQNTLSLYPPPLNLYFLPPNMHLASEKHLGPAKVGILGGVPPKVEKWFHVSVLNLHMVTIRGNFPVP